MTPIKIAINGFGRIGRSLFRLLLDNPEIEVVAVNDLANVNTLAHLLKYDSIHGRLDRTVSVINDTTVVVDGVEFPFTNQPDISSINWALYQPDVVIECTGKFKTKELLQNHITGGAKKVILSVPPIEDDIKTFSSLNSALKYCSNNDSIDTTFVILLNA